MKETKFSRLEKVIGKENINKLKSKSVLILGCGGVGGYVCEALARSGIGTLILVDFDTITESNINRLIIALRSTIGKLKVDVLKDRVKDINSSCKVIKVDKFIDTENIVELFKYDIDYLVMPGIARDTKQRGETLITSHKDSSVDIKQIPLTSIEQYYK